MMAAMRRYKCTGNEGDEELHVAAAYAGMLVAMDIVRAVLRAAVGMPRRASHVARCLRHALPPRRRCV